MELKILLYWKDIWKLKFDIEKCNLLNIGSQNVKFDYQINNKDIKRVNEECDLGVDFDDNFKTNNHILSIVLKAKEMISWVIKNFISREENVVLRIYKTSYRILYSGLGSSIETWKLKFNIEIGGIHKRVTKIIKRVQDYS